MARFELKDLTHALRSNPDLRLENSADSASTPAHLEHQPAPSERALQHQMFEECDRRALNDARYACIFAIPNGQYRQGQAPEPGMKSGVPDVLLSVPSRGYHGLYLELKVGRNRTSPDQRAWARRLRDHGYYVAVVRDSLRAIFDVLDWYLNIPKGERHESAERPLQQQ